MAKQELFLISMVISFNIIKLDFTTERQSIINLNNNEAIAYIKIKVFCCCEKWNEVIVSFSSNEICIFKKTKRFDQIKYSNIISFSDLRNNIEEKLTVSLFYYNDKNGCIVNKINLKTKRRVEYNRLLSLMRQNISMSSSNKTILNNNSLKTTETIIKSMNMYIYNIHSTIKSTLLIEIIIKKKLFEFLYKFAYPNKDKPSSKSLPENIVGSKILDIELNNTKNDIVSRSNSPFIKSNKIA